METTNYLILGYTVIFGVLLLHMASLIWRNQNLHRDLRMFEKLAKHSGQKRRTGKKFRR